MSAKKRSARKSRARGIPAGTKPVRRSPTPEDVQAAREVVSRAIRRLNLLETLIMGAAAVVALLGGWLGALLARSAFGLPLRTTWMVLSLLLFIVPAVVAWTMERRRRREARDSGASETRKVK